MNNYGSHYGSERKILDQKIVIDTSFLLLPYDHIDIFTAFTSYGPVTLLIPEECIKELIVFSSLNSKKGKAARIALSLISKQKNLKIIPSTQLKRADDAIIDLIKLLKKERSEVYVATLDKELKKRAIKEGAIPISIKNKQVVFGR